MESLSKTSPPSKSAPRTQRFKTTCNECSRRKIKCNKSQQASCQYCLHNSFACVYAPIVPRAPKRKRAPDLQSQPEDVAKLDFPKSIGPTTPELLPVTWPSPVSLLDYLDDEHNASRPNTRRCISDPTGMTGTAMWETSHWWTRPDEPIHTQYPSSILWHHGSNIVPYLDLPSDEVGVPDWPDQVPLYEQALVYGQQQGAIYNNSSGIGYQHDFNPQCFAEEQNHLYQPSPYAPPTRYSSRHGSTFSDTDNSLPEPCEHHIYDLLQELGKPPNGQLGSPSDTNYCIDDILARTDDAIDRVSDVLECPCAVNQSVLFPLSLVVFEVIAWYEDVTRCLRESHDSSIKLSRQVVPLVKIGQYEVDRSGAVLLIEHLIRGRIAKVRTLLESFEDGRPAIVSDLEDMADRIDRNLRS